MVTKDQAQTVSNFEYTTLKGSDNLPVRCRSMGKCQVWKTRPNEFKLPVKYGLYQSFYITQDNANEWTAA
jgi:hypothetical protein